MMPCTESGIHYRTTGSGDPLLMLHGVTLDSRMWVQQVNAFAGQYRCLAVDRRGHGRSAPMADGMDAAADLIEVLDHAGADRCHLIGFSLGGMDAVELAGRFPERVRSLLLIGAWLPIPEMHWAPPARVVRQEGVEAGRQAWLNDPLFAPARRDPAVWSALTEMITGNDLAIWARRFQPPDPAPPAAAALAVSIAAPTRVAIGELDLPAFHAVARWLQAAIPGAANHPAAIIPGAGHLAPMERPDAFDALVREFLAQVG